MAFLYVIVYVRNCVVWIPSLAKRIPLPASVHDPGDAPVHRDRRPRCQENDLPIFVKAQLKSGLF